MAAHEEKISGKRRKLFKALSVAPVVMTLRPGSALANQSAFQCLQNDGNISNWHQSSWPHINNPCQDGDTCYAYERRNYIDTKTGEAVKDAQGKSLACPAVHHIIIQANGGYLDFNGANATPFVAADVNNTGYLVLKDGNGTVCINKIPVQEGLFAVVGHPVDGGTDFAIDGTFPEARIGGGTQGITGTCLDSFVPGASAGYTLSKG